MAYLSGNPLRTGLVSVGASNGGGVPTFAYLPLLGLEIASQALASLVVNPVCHLLIPQPQDAAVNLFESLDLRLGVCYILNVG